MHPHGARAGRRRARAKERRSEDGRGRLGLPPTSKLLAHNAGEVGWNCKDSSGGIRLFASVASKLADRTVHPRGRAEGESWGKAWEWTSMSQETVNDGAPAEGASASPLLYDEGSRSFLEGQRSQFDTFDHMAKQLNPTNARTSATPLGKTLVPEASSTTKRKRAKSQTATSHAAAKQTEVTRLLSRLPNNKDAQGPLTVFTLLQEFDFVELSKLAQYQGDTVSPHSTKKELAEGVLSTIRQGGFSQEMRTQPAVPKEKESVAPFASMVPTTATAPHSASRQQHTPFLLREAWQEWKPLSSSDCAALSTVRNDSPAAEKDPAGAGAYEGGAGGGRWTACSAVTEALLETDNPCYACLRILRESKTSLRDWAVNAIKQSRSLDRGISGGRLLSRSPAMREIRRQIVALQPSHLSALAEGGSGSRAEMATSFLAERANASTQTSGPGLPELGGGRANRPYASHVASHHKATKVLRFDADKLGLTLKEVPRDCRDQARLAGKGKTVLQAIRRDRVDEAAARLLCVGDELIMVNGEDIMRLPFSDQMDLLTTAGRPVFLTFCTS